MTNASFGGSRRQLLPRDEIISVAGEERGQWLLDVDARERVEW